MTHATELTDARLMEAAAGGDLDAFAEIVWRYQTHAWRVAFRFLGDAMDAEDVAQEAFLKILKAAPRYRPKSAFRTYLYTVVYRLCIDHRRKARPALSDEMDTIPATASDATEDLLAHERGREIQQALDRLPPLQRAAIVLRHYEDLSYAEIAQVLDITVKSVEMRIRRARENLSLALSHLKGP